MSNGYLLQWLVALGLSLHQYAHLNKVINGTYCLEGISYFEYVRLVGIGKIGVTTALFTVSSTMPIPSMVGSLHKPLFYVVEQSRMNTSIPATVCMWWTISDLRYWRLPRLACCVGVCCSRILLGWHKESRPFWSTAKDGKFK